MARLQSLGLHEPSALSYLVSEGLLAPSPSPTSYKWNYQHVPEGTSQFTDEVLETANCVVWSRNGMVKRVFNLDMEGEVINHAFTTYFGDQHSLTQSMTSADRALVVILKTQAHIFLLSGGIHVLPLSFEVQRAIPAAFGFLLQRNTSQDQAKDKIPLIAKTTLRNGLLPSDPQGQDKQYDARLSEMIHSAAGRERLSMLPRTFALSELLSELSLVVSSSLRKREPLDRCAVLSSDEEIAYLSTADELHQLHEAGSEPVYLAISTNSKTKALTLWQVLYNHSTEEDTNRVLKTDRPVNSSKRKSSNVYGRQTGAATPTVRGPGTLRESIGGLTQSIPESGVFSSGREMTQPQTGDFTAQLEHEFEQVGVQTRSARRVSSMLARTDLGGANDRSAFNEIAIGSINRKSFGRSMRRVESLGGFSDRQSFGTRRRSSFQAVSSIYSDGTSFLDIPASYLLDDSAAQPGMDVIDESTKLESTSRLPRSVAFMKLKSLSYECNDGRDKEQQSLKVMTMLMPDQSTADDRRSRVICICIMDKKRQEMTIVNVAAKTALSASQTKAERTTYDLKALEVRRGQSIVDACTVEEGCVKRLLVLTQTREGTSVLHLEAPWSISYRVDIPTQSEVFDTSNTTRGDSLASRQETGIRRHIPNSETEIEIEIKSLQDCEAEDQVLAYDAEHRCHRLRFQLMPNQPLVRNILQLCNLVLAPEFFDSLLIAWWEVKRWIETQDPEPNIEWTAMVVTLFLLAVPFIGIFQSRPAHISRQREDGMLRSSTSPKVDLSHWDLMQEIENTSTDRICTAHCSWSWIDTITRHKVEHKSPSKHSRTASSDAADDKQTDSFLIRCTNMARDFLQSPAGESATGPEGYLPIAVNKDRASRRTALASILVGLHLLREEFKLHSIASSMLHSSSDDLAFVIAQIASWLKWKDWRLEPGCYYYSEANNPAHWMIETSVIDNLEIPAQPFQPPSIFLFVEKSINANSDTSFPSLLDLISQSRPISQSHPLWKEAARITPRLFALTAFVAQLKQKKGRSIIKCMLKCGINNDVLSTLPAGVASACHQAIAIVKSQSPTDWSADIRAILGRVDVDTDQSRGDPKSGPNNTSHVHDALRDYRTISNNAIDADSISRWDAPSEVDRQAITRLIFNHDRRFQEASKLVNQTRPPVVECTPEPGWSEADMLEAQKELAVHVTRRTLSVAAGRAMMHFNARVPLLTEKVPIPAFSLQCVIKSRGTSDNTQPMTLSADKALFTEDKVCWAFFHNGASAGLMVSKDTRWIDTSWILYNKPPELTNRHAGFLLALGLNGHLKSMAKWVAFKYLTPKHTMTSVGLLLGLAASYLGTMDTLIARLLSVHVTRLLPVGAAELNLSPLTQTTGIMGVGLLYCKSQHRRMSEIMLSEIENNDSEERSGDEPILRDEGYRLAAGFSLGLINLGQGKRLHSLHDMGVVERLLTIAISTKNVNMVHVLDRATAGAVIAVAFIFMKTNDETIAQKIDIPDTAHQFDYVRPDVFLLRTLARHLIMWKGITPTQDFIRTSLPPAFRKRADLSTTKRLSTDDLPFFNIVAGICFAMSLRFAGSHQGDTRDLLISYLDQFLRLTKLPALNYDAKVTLNGIRNCLDVLALSCSTVMAGSGDIIVMRRLRALHGRTDEETPFGSHLAAHMALGVLFLSGGTATFGTSNLAVAALVISLYPLFPVDVLDNKGHLQALRHLWVLAVENRCLVAKDVETQQVINEIEAQVELVGGTKTKLKSPGLLPAFEYIRKVSFQHENYWPVTVDFDHPAKLRTKVNKHGDAGKVAQQTTREYLTSCGMGLKISLQRRAAYEKPSTDIFFSELQALDEARGVPSVDRNAGVNEKWQQIYDHSAAPENAQNKNPFHWVFGLDVLKHLDFAERALVLDDACTNGEGMRFLSETAVDTMLDFESSCWDPNNDDDSHELQEKHRLSNVTVNRDKLWQLRLLLGWADRWEQDEEEAGRGNGSDSASGQEPASWMKKEAIEQLRCKVWKMASKEGGQHE